MNNSAIWTVSLPKTLEKEVLKVIKKEHRTKSELVREALRRYISGGEDVDILLGRVSSALDEELGNKLDVASLPSLREQFSR